MPVRPFRSATTPGLPRKWPLPCFRPVALLPDSFTGCASSLRSPLGFLGPSRSLRSTGFAAVRPAFRIHPISAHSSQPILLLDKTANHRLRSVVFPEACCSSKPLGTNPNMIQDAFPVNRFLCREDPFSSYYYCRVSNILQAVSHGKAVDKPGRAYYVTARW